MPSKGATNYEEKMSSSLVGEFNRTQQEKGRGGCSDGSAWNWLKQDRPKYALYPHKSDYCDFCAHKHEEIHCQQTTLNRIRQTGSSSEENQKVIEEEIERLEDPTTGSAIMKVRKTCFEGSFEDTPMKVTRHECALPAPTHSYAMQNRIRSLSDAKLKDMRHMYSHYIDPELWHFLQ